MKVLVGCEFSGVVREAFRKRGHDAWSCDLLPSADDSPYHIEGDVLDVAGDNWDIGIFHPPCTYLASSGLHWNKRVEGREKKTEEALEFCMKIWDLSKDYRIAMENPVGALVRELGPPDQYIQHYEYGEDASKRTCLWLNGLPLLTPTKFVPPRLVLSKDGRSYKMRWSNQTDSGQNRLGPSEDRWKLRSITPQGLADAMADQWVTYMEEYWL